MKIFTTIALVTAITVPVAANAFTFTGNLGLDLTRAAAALGQWYSNHTTINYAPYGPVYRNMTNAQAQSVLRQFLPTPRGSGSQPSYSYSPSQPSPGTSDNNPPD